MKKHFNKHEVKTLREMRRDTLAQVAAKVTEMQPGDLIEGEGVYLGRYVPEDREGASLCQIFNVFAAPEDLPGGIRKYVDTVKAVSQLKNWHGHDGTHYDTDKEFYAALYEDTYRGGWIIPTSDILCGKDLNDDDTMADSILAHKEAGKFKNTFQLSEWNYYWSCTEFREAADYVRGARLSLDTDRSWDHKDSLRLFCRPVRLVAV